MRKSEVAGLMVCLLLLFALFTASAWQYEKISAAYSGLAEIRLAEGFSFEDVEKLQKDRAEKGGGIRYMAWTQLPGTTLSEPSLSRTQTADAVIYCGDESARFSLVFRGGCEVSERVAFALWGTTAAEGFSLTIGEREYVVERVAKDGWTTGYDVLARWDEGDETSQSQGNGTGENEENRGNLRFDVLGTFYEEGTVRADASGAKGTVLDYAQWLSALSALRRWPLWGISAFLCIRIGTGAKKDTGKRERGIRILREGAALLLLTGTGLLAGSPIWIPRSFFPTRWSDFSFWSKTAEDAWMYLWTIVGLECYGPDLFFREACLKLAVLCVIQTALAVAAAIWVLRKAGGWDGIGRIKGYCKALWRRCYGGQPF